MEYTHTNEDKIIFEKYFSKYTLDGSKYYAEIGASDGITYSNTLYYEKELGWTGILIEPNSVLFNRLISSRMDKNTLVNIAISDLKEPIQFNLCVGFPLLSCIESTRPPITESYYYQSIIDKYTTLSVVLDTVLKKSSIPRIDFCVVDTVGHELNVLKSFTFTYPVVLWSINFSYTQTSKDQIINYMTDNNCKFMEEINGHGIFINNNYLQYFNL